MKSSSGDDGGDVHPTRHTKLEPVVALRPTAQGLRFSSSDAQQQYGGTIYVVCTLRSAERSTSVVTLLRDT